MTPQDRERYTRNQREARARARARKPKPQRLDALDYKALNGLEAMREFRKQEPIVRWSVTGAWSI